MWEEATPAITPSPAPSADPAQNAQREQHPRAVHDPVLLAQLLLCAAALGAVLALRALQAPLYGRLRVALTAALTQAEDSSQLFAEERHFLPFIQQSIADLGDAALEVWSALTAPSDAGAGDTAADPADKTAAVRRRPRAVPQGSTLQSYCPPFALALPLPGDGYAVSSGYGWRTDPVAGYGDDFHLGTDLPAPEGTAVLAAAGGVVLRAGHNSGYGNYLRVLHAGGDETLYAHLQYLFVHAGQPVTQGMRLGTVGQTGNATGPHLHFELLHQGVRYDPTVALQAARPAAFSL